MLFNPHPFFKVRGNLLSPVQRLFGPSVKTIPIKRKQGYLAVNKVRNKMPIANILKSTFGAMRKETVLYYPGCMTQAAFPKLLSNYKSLLSDAGVNFKMLPELSCCGSPLLSAGYIEDFAYVRKRNLELLKKNSITKVITNCPHCYDILKNEYGLNVEHTLQFFETRVHKLSFGRGEEVSFHDPCLLSRKNNIVKEPRNALKKAGYSMIEPALSKEKSFCCGAGGGLKQFNPTLADRIAKRRLSQFRSSKVIVSCPYCYAHLKENSAGSSKELVEFSEAVFEE
jgi:heterodisulfide reductase subunit D